MLLPNQNRSNVPTIEQQALRRHVQNMDPEQQANAVVLRLTEIQSRVAPPESTEFFNVVQLASAQGLTNANKGIVPGSFVTGQPTREFNGIGISCYQGSGGLFLGGWSSLNTGVTAAQFYTTTQFFFLPAPAMIYIPIGTQQSVSKITIFSDPSATQSLIATIALLRF